MTAPSDGHREDRRRAAQPPARAGRRAARGEITIPEISEALLEAAGHAVEADDLPLLGMLIHRTAPAEIAATLRIPRSELDRRMAGVLARLRVPISVVP